jgi:hypothetical protein
VTGAEHYLEAERLLREAGRCLDADVAEYSMLSPQQRLDLQAGLLAMVTQHALLAVAAAAALSTVHDPQASHTATEWARAIAVTPARPGPAS